MASDRAGDRGRRHATRPRLVLEDDRDRELRGGFLAAAAKAMNQVVLEPGTPVSPVPRLPTTDQPGICAAVPVPRSTARRIIRATEAAVSESRHA